MNPSFAKMRLNVSFLTISRAKHQHAAMVGKKKFSCIVILSFQELG